MIFVTYGTEEFRFERLSATIDLIIKNKKFNHEKFVIQMGRSYNEKYNSFKNVDAFEYCTNERYNSFMDDARIIICHGGVGSIISALSRGKIPIVMSRLKKYSEQVDDHQIQIVGEFESKGYILSLSKNSKLDYILDNYYEVIKYLKRYVHEDSSVGHFINKKYFTCENEK